MQMLCGGVLLAMGSAIWGEPWSPSAWSTRSTLSLLYCIAFGSVLAFACYTWLLERVRTEIVATHVFVNPFVATALGAWLGGEQLGLGQLLAAAFILASVRVITS